MERVIAIFDFIFGCHHRHLSRVFTMGGRTYRVCCDCGADFRYSLEHEHGAAFPDSWGEDSLNAFRRRLVKAPSSSIPRRSYAAASLLG